VIGSLIESATAHLKSSVVSLIIEDLALPLPVPGRGRASPTKGGTPAIMRDTTDDLR